MATWKITLEAGKPAVEAALLAQDANDEWDPEIVVSGHEIDPDQPDAWALEAWLPRRPTAADKKVINALFAGAAPPMAVEKVPEEDWVALSQAGTEPIRAGRFFVHTPDYAALAEDGVTDLCIPASQAFGTGHHKTTAGCLAMLCRMRASGVIVRNYADIGTGTGLLAFAARDLWPTALGIASDIDPVCEAVVEDNAAANGVPLGERAGEIVMTVATGMDSPVIAARAPYDLVIANILAGPLVELAADFGKAVVPGGHLLLAGLLTSQEAAVHRAAFRAGFRLARRMVDGDWSILWLRRRASR